MLRDAVARAGRSELLVQRPLPPMRDKVPGSDLQGYVHCGFTAAQIGQAWGDLRRWTETGQKPAANPPPAVAADAATPAQNPARNH